MIPAIMCFALGLVCCKKFCICFLKDGLYGFFFCGTLLYVLEAFRADIKKIFIAFSGDDLALGV